MGKDNILNVIFTHVTNSKSWIGGAQLGLRLYSQY